MSMYEKDDRTEEILDILRIMSTKIDMCLSDTDELKETMNQLKLFIEAKEEEKRIEFEQKNTRRWKREVL